MDAIIEQFFNVEIMARTFPIILRGLGMTVLVCIAVVPLGLLGGLAVAFSMQTRFRPVRLLIAAFVDLFRAIPPLVLLIFVHSGLPFAGIQLTAFDSVCLTFFLNTSAYYGEVYRAGIESVGLGQLAARASRQPSRTPPWPLRGSQTT